MILETLMVLAWITVVITGFLLLLWIININLTVLYTVVSTIITLGVPYRNFAIVSAVFIYIALVSKYKMKMLELNSFKEVLAQLTGEETKPSLQE